MIIMIIVSSSVSYITALTYRDGTNVDNTIFLMFDITLADCVDTILQVNSTAYTEWSKKAVPQF